MKRDFSSGNGGAIVEASNAQTDTSLDHTVPAKGVRVSCPEIVPTSVLPEMLQP